MNMQIVHLRSVSCPSQGLPTSSRTTRPTPWDSGQIRDSSCCDLLREVLPGSESQHPLPGWESRADLPISEVGLTAPSSRSSCEWCPSGEAWLTKDLRPLMVSPTRGHAHLLTNPSAEGASCTEHLEFSSLTRAEVPYAFVWLWRWATSNFFSPAC